MALGASLVLHAGTLALLAHPADGWRRQIGDAPRRAPLRVVALPTQAMLQQGVPQLQAAVPEPRPPAMPAAIKESPATSEAPGDDAATQLGIGIVPYLPAKLLDERPRVVFDIPYELPQLSGYPQSGKLVMTLKIGASGEVDDVEVDATTLPDIFAEETARVFRQARFTPGRKGGSAVGTLLRIEVSYQPLATPAAGHQPPSPPAPASSRPLGKGKNTPSE